MVTGPRLVFSVTESRIASQKTFSCISKVACRFMFGLWLLIPFSTFTHRQLWSVSEKSRTGPQLVHKLVSATESRIASQKSISCISKVAQMDFDTCQVLRIGLEVPQSVQISQNVNWRWTGPRLVFNWRRGWKVAICGL